ncbi:MAG: hypothetical protein L0312_12515 [Acidobacteria bacterium]|nr:hypothetical protein [Acidobacteriota bacterium]
MSRRTWVRGALRLSLKMVLGIAVVFALAVLENLGRVGALENAWAVRGGQTPKFSCQDQCTRAIGEGCPGGSSPCQGKGLGDACGNTVIDKFKLLKCVSDPAGLVNCTNDSNEDCYFGKLCTCQGVPKTCSISTAPLQWFVNTACSKTCGGTNPAGNQCPGAP